MKRMIGMQVLAGVALVCGGCERHTWQETKVLHEQHGGGHGAAASEHGKAETGHEGKAAAEKSAEQPGH